MEWRIRLGDSMKRIWERYILQYKEIIVYIFWGAATTLVNYVIYFICTKLFDIYYIASNIIAWGMSVAFAYVVNKLFVFGSRDWSRKRLLKEIWQFTAARVFSGMVETGMLWGLVDIMGFGDSAVKIIAGIIVVALNYVVSKWVVFRHSGES